MSFTGMLLQEQTVAVFATLILKFSGVVYPMLHVLPVSCGESDYWWYATLYFLFRVGHTCLHDVKLNFQNSYYQKAS